MIPRTTPPALLLSVEDSSPEVESIAEGDVAKESNKSSVVPSSQKLSSKSKLLDGMVRPELLLLVAALEDSTLNMVSTRRKEDGDEAEKEDFF